MLFLAVGAVVSQSLDVKLSQKTLKGATEKALAIMDKYDIEAANTKVKNRLAAIGLSYNPAVTVPTDLNILVGKDKRQLAILWGMYTSNLSYALEFGKRFDGIIECMGKIEEKLNFDSVLFRQDPLYKNNAKKNGQFMYALIQKTLEDPSLLPVVIGGMYGLDMEAIYGVCQLGLMSGITSDYLAFMNDFIPGMQITKEIVAVYEKAIAEDPNKPIELAKTLDTAAKGNVMQSLTEIARNCKGVYKESDLRAMVAVIEKVRAPLIAKAR